MLCVSTLVCLYYNVIIAWTFYYLGSSFQSPLPWSCDAVANAGLCGNISAGNGSGRILSPSEIFWKCVCLHLSQLASLPAFIVRRNDRGSAFRSERVLGVVNSEGLQDPGPVRWPLALCLLAAWILIFLCMLKGIRSSGKVTRRSVSMLCSHTHTHAPVLRPRCAVLRWST